MSRKSNSPDIDLNPINSPAIEKLLEAATYLPTDKEIALKAKFWLLAGSNPLVDPQSVGKLEVREVLQTEALNSSWAKPGFKEWFLNTDETRQKLEYLFSLALNAAEQILVNTDPKAQSARVNMIKLIADLAGKSPQKAKDSGALAAIGSMDRVQLEAFMQKNGVNLQLSASKGSDTITVQAETVKPVDSSDD